MCTSMKPFHNSCQNADQSLFYSDMADVRQVKYEFALMVLQTITVFVKWSLHSGGSNLLPYANAMGKYLYLSQRQLEVFSSLHFTNCSNFLLQSDLQISIFWGAVNTFEKLKEIIEKVSGFP